jgi:hypothetical protein
VRPPLRLPPAGPAAPTKGSPTRRRRNPSDLLARPGEQQAAGPGARPSRPGTRSCSETPGSPTDTAEGYAEPRLPGQDLRTASPPGKVLGRCLVCRSAGRRTLASCQASRAIIATTADLLEHRALRDRACRVRPRDRACRVRPVWRRQGRPWPPCWPRAAPRPWPRPEQLAAPAAAIALPLADRRGRPRRQGQRRRRPAAPRAVWPAPGRATTSLTRAFLSKAAPAPC